jgi:UDP-3-O-acyl N-acetylglucosamine deacetylase
VAGEIELAGTGIHSGRETHLRILPAAADTGLRFRRVDLPGRPEIPATLDYVLAGQLDRRTTVGLDESACVQTIEHVLSACVAFGIDNAVFELDGREMPFFDGSAFPVARAIRNAGIRKTETPCRYLTLTQPVIFDHYPVQIVAFPARSLRITYFIEFDSEVVPVQAGHEEITPKKYLRRIAPARTFCFARDVERLREQGLIKGGNLDCAVVIGEDRILNEELRFPDEMIRHKMVDLLGDIGLLGRPLLAHVSAWRAGHVWHIEFLKQLKEAVNHG